MDINITLEGLLLGALAIAIGLAFAFWGFRVFLVLLPIWGFFAGFILGANGVEYLLGDGFLATTSGWVVGFILGLIFAVLSYLYYWVAVILLGGVLGYQLTLGVFEWLNLNPDGWIAFISGLIVGAVFAVGFFLLHMPAVLVIVATAISGAAATVAGVIVGLGFVPLAALDRGIVGVYNAHDWGILWLIVGIVLAFAGGIYQTRMVADLSASITEDSYRNPGISGTSAA
jgi:hypothetical protein